MYFFVMAVILIAGCAKDDTMFETPDNLALKKAKVPIPFKADLYAIPDMNSDPILVVGLDPEDPNSYSLSKLIVGGTASHAGRINAEKSFYEFDRMEFVVENGDPLFKNTGIGILIGANGDGLEYTFLVKQLLDGSCTGVAEIIPGKGTGKFEGCTGTIDILGGWSENDNNLWFKIQGYLVYE